MLAKHHNISLEELLRANMGIDPYHLRIGQKICIPGHMTMPEEMSPSCKGITHTVVSGDTLYMLAKRYKTTLDEIMDANPQIDCYMLQVGMKLCIPTATSRCDSWSARMPDQMAPSMPTAPTIPQTPLMPSAPTMPQAPSIPELPQMPPKTIPGVPAMPSVPTPSIPIAPTAPVTPPTGQQPSPMPIEQPGVAPVCEGFMHTVRAGDTLYLLARQYKITLDALMKANPKLDPYSLRIGMQLCIPVSSGTSSSDTNLTAPAKADPSYESKENDYQDNRDNQCMNGKLYRTQRGDTLTRILDRYEITFAAIQSSNPNVDFTDSLENMTLCIPSEDPYRTCPMSGAYIVKSGDTLDSISKKLLVMSDNLLMANPTLTIEDFAIPGTKVCIPG